MKILFICHGNICRSPMAEFVMKDLVQQKGIEARYEIASAATTDEEIWGNRGNPIYPSAREVLQKHGISVKGKYAILITKEDYDYYDYMIVMERLNLREIKSILPKDPDHKIHLLLEYTGENKDIDDPWYSGDFDLAYQEIERGCKALLEYLEK